MNNKLNSLVRPLSRRILPLTFRSILLTALFMTIVSPASPALAATTPVTLTITELRQTGGNFDIFIMPNNIGIAVMNDIMC